MASLSPSAAMMACFTRARPDEIVIELADTTSDATAAASSSAAEARSSSTAAARSSLPRAVSCEEDGVPSILAGFASRARASGSSGSPMAFGGHSGLFDHRRRLESAQTDATTSGPSRANTGVSLRGLSLLFLTGDPEPLLEGGDPSSPAHAAAAGGLRGAFGGAFGEYGSAAIVCRRTPRFIVKCIVQLLHQVMQLCALAVYAGHMQFRCFETQCVILLVETVLSTVITCQDRDVRRWLLARPRGSRCALLIPVVFVMGFGQLIHVKRAWARQIHAAEVMTQLEGNDHLWTGPVLGGEAALPLGFLTGSFTALIAFQSFIMLPSTDLGTLVLGGAVVSSVLLMSLCVVEVDNSVSVYVASRYHFDPNRRGSRVGSLQWLFPFVHVLFRCSEVLFRVGCLSLLSILMEEQTSVDLSLVGSAWLVCMWLMGVLTLWWHSDEDESLLAHMLVAVALLLANVVRFVDMPGYCRPAKMISWWLELSQAMNLILLTAIMHWVEAVEVGETLVIVNRQFDLGMHVVVASMLVYYPMAVNIFRRNGDDLHSAAAGRRHLRLKKLLDAGGGGEALDVNEPVKMRSRCTPLMLAAALGDEVSLKLLLDAGANLDAMDTSGRTCFHYAVEHHMLKAVRLLAERPGSAAILRRHGPDLQQRLRQIRFVNRELQSETEALLTPASTRKRFKRFGNLNVKPTAVSGTQLTSLFPEAVQEDVPPLHRVLSVGGLVLAHAVGSLAHLFLTRKRGNATGRPTDSFEIEQLRRVRVLGQGAFGQVIEVEEISHRPQEETGRSVDLGTSFYSIGRMLTARVPALLVSQGSATNSSNEIAPRPVEASPTFEARSGTFESGSRRFAMKLQQKSVSDSQWHVCAEAVALQRIAHPFIVRLMHAFQTPQYFVLVLELCMMDMNQRIVGCADASGFCPGLPQLPAARYGGQVLLALSYMHHTHKIVYRDMKPQNVLVSNTDEAKLADFGTARYIGDGRHRRAMTLAGTRGFLAPELVCGLADSDSEGEDSNGEADPFLQDSFAYGITLAIMLTGEHFAEKGDKNFEDSFMPTASSSAAANVPALLPRAGGEAAQIKALRDATKAGHLNADACELLERLIQHRPRMRACLLDPSVRGHAFFLKTLNCGDLEVHLLPAGASALGVSHETATTTSARGCSPTFTTTSL